MTIDIQQPDDDAVFRLPTQALHATANADPVAPDTSDLIELPREMQRVQCTLAGYQHLGVWYDVGVPFSSIEALGNDTVAIMEILSIEVDGWNFKDRRGNPIPAPSYQNGLQSINISLLRWIINTGYPLAIQQFAAPPNLEGGLMPTLPNATTPASIKPQSKRRTK